VTNSDLKPKPRKLRNASAFIQPSSHVFNMPSLDGNSVIVINDVESETPEERVIVHREEKLGAWNQEEMTLVIRSSIALYENFINPTGMERIRFQADLGDRDLEIALVMDRDTKSPADEGAAVYRLSRVKYS